MNKAKLAIIGAGNIGTAIAKGLARRGDYPPDTVTLTRRKTHLLEPLSKEGFKVEQDNRKAVSSADIVLIAVEPQQLDDVLAEIGPALDPKKHILVSVVSGVTIAQIRSRVGQTVPLVRAMPNTAVAIGESMTCVASDGVDGDGLARVRGLFDSVGHSLVIDEEQMTAATALGACGVAFFLRAIRAASQGGIEIGFHAGEALTIAAQTARGAASLLLSAENHPEYEIDRVTTPRGCTIAGLNRMEHAGFSSALIKGITTSAEKADLLYNDRD